MKLNVRKHLLAVALVAGVAGGAVVAQTQPPQANGPGTESRQSRHHDPAKMAERVNQRLANLKQKLQVTPAQEAAWTSFANAMQPPAQRPRADREALARMTTPDRIDHMRALRDQRNAEMDRRADATKAFYAQLSAEQKKTFDDESARMFQRGGRHMGRHHG
ncbi:Spy/CpxP family protein refolding chaperone [Ramlibacter tataouinensis]|uniref:Spy/CpxP family protein refolding chaperone n=1 Tax=Ramlibacter tataouinensis TaxID=94132 RepID=UPI0022F3F2AE|nr:Spy/CpxP family protein refolding chaperone [Ramlibacter tataouinensis]WBY00030.1 Spy/CpxP family protein refolding chaperone [Ramlibacter tataouinensis]